LKNVVGKIDSSEGLTGLACIMSGRCHSHP